MKEKKPAEARSGKVRGVNVSISPKAYNIIDQAAFAAKPKKRSLRAQINILLNLNEDE